MADDKKPAAPLEPVPDPKAPAEKQTVAVHDDRMWDGAQYVDGLPGRPYVTGKKQYLKLLNDAGLRMKHQQESTTGPKKDRPITVEDLLPPVVVVPPMTQEEAHVYGAITAVFKHYELIETLWCEDCFARGRHHGCRMRVTPKHVLLECRCGHAMYQAPTGTTDLVLSRLPNIARTLADTTAGTIMTDAGPVARPTAILHDMEALLLRRYFSALRARHKEPRLFHRACFDGHPQHEAQALALAVSPERLVLLCQCRTLFHQSARIIRAPLRVM
jgi:hypothetical protein